MLKAIHHKDFKKDYKKLSAEVREKFGERFLLFLKDQRLPFLRDHELKRNLKGKRAFSVTGNVRVIYKYVEEETILLLRVGTHNQVY